MAVAVASVAAHAFGLMSHARAYGATPAPASRRTRDVITAPEPGLWCKGKGII